MKKYIVLFIVLVGTNIVYAQGPFPKRFEKIKAHKTAYITNQLELTPSEAERFWPVYNQYEKKIHQLEVIDKKAMIRSINEMGGVENLSENEAEKKLHQLDELQEAIIQTKRKKFNKLQEVLSAKKVLKLFKAEQDFKKELLKRLRERRRERFN